MKTKTYILFDSNKNPNYLVINNKDWEKLKTLVDKILIDLQEAIPLGKVKKWTSDSVRIKYTIFMSYMRLLNELIHNKNIAEFTFVSVADCPFLLEEYTYLHKNDFQ